MKVGEEMGKLLWTLAAAAMGFVAAVAATPEDEVCRAYERGFADGAKALQSEAVRRGYGGWQPAEAVGDVSAFRWAGQLSRSRESRTEEHQRRGNDSSRSAQREKKNALRSDRGLG